MSLHYLLDGYNIVHQMPISARSKLEDQRQYLIQWIESRHPQGSSRNMVTVVFDGKSEIWSSGTSLSSSVRIIFSRDETADEKIIRMVEEEAHRKSVVVVTDDRSLQYSVRALGAKVSQVAAFMKKSSTQEQISDRCVKPQPGKNISKTLEYKITSELTKIWLDKPKF